MIISPAMMKVFDECQQKFVYMYIDKINLPQNKYFYEKGKNIHAAASYFLKGFDMTKIEAALTDEEKNIWNNLKSSEYFKYHVVGSEYQLSKKLGEDWIGGRLDALVKNGEDYYILDYKTGSVPQNPEFDYQTMVYLLCANELIKKYNSLSFIYLDLKNNSEKIIPFSKNLEKEYLQKIEKTVSNIKFVKNTKNIMLKNNKCKCDYYCICDKN